jgi:hypothetical protein
MLEFFDSPRVDLDSDTATHTYLHRVSLSKSQRASLARAVLRR